VRTATRPYAEHGGTSLSREARRIWSEPDPAPVCEPAAEFETEAESQQTPDVVLPWPPRLNGKRCKTCQYRSDALGHAKICGVSA